MGPFGLDCLRLQCCGSTVFVNGGTSEAESQVDGLLVFSGPDSASRKNMSIYTSADNGDSWQWLYQLGDPSLTGAYSSLAVINVRLPTYLRPAQSITSSLC